MAWQHVTRVAGLAVLAVALAPTLWMRSATNAAVPGDTQIAQLIASPHRRPDNSVRDKYRHPAKLIAFLGIKPDARVVEIAPGSAGYWTEILAPYLKDRGRYIAGGPSPVQGKAGIQQEIEKFAAKLAADPARYGKVEVVEFTPDKLEFVPQGSVDYVLTFRNLHNWMGSGRAEQALAAFHKALKPGGMLGIEEHRGRADVEQDPRAKTGYVRQDYAIAMIEKAGFKLAGQSEANANRRDTKDHPAGVWTLPPTWRLGEQDRAKYAAIGESDRFVLKFVKR